MQGKAFVHAVEWVMRVQLFCWVASGEVMQQFICGGVMRTATALLAVVMGANAWAEGVGYQSLRLGKGRSPTPDDIVKIQYRGQLLSGATFDTSYGGEPLEVLLSQAIPCWTEGLQKMKPGGKARLTCPPESAYGEYGAGSVPPKATITFDIELLEIVKPPEMTAAMQEELANYARLEQEQQAEREQAAARKLQQEQEAARVAAQRQQEAARQAEQRRAQESFNNTLKTIAAGVDAYAKYRAVKSGQSLPSANASAGAVLGSGKSSVCAEVLPTWAAQCINRCNEWMDYNRKNSHMRDAPPNEREHYLKKNLIGVMLGHKAYHAVNYEYMSHQYPSGAQVNEVFVRQMRANAAGSEKTLANPAVGGETKVDNAFVYGCMFSAVADELEANPVPELEMSPVVERVKQCPGYDTDESFSGTVIPTHAGVVRTGGFDACVRKYGG